MSMNREEQILDSMTTVTTKKLQDLDMPTFRIKRAHKKSRLGCMECKRRRVKVGLSRLKYHKRKRSTNDWLLVR